MKTKLLFAGVPSVTLLLLGGCANGPAGDPADLDEPLFGSSRATRFTMSSATGEFKVRDVVAVAKVLRRYKTLDAAEKALIKLAIEKQIDALVSLEVEKIAPKYEPERRRIAAMPDKQVAKVAIAELDDKIHREARANVDRRFHTVALPVRALGNRTVVAFAKVREGKAQVAGAAFEVETPAGGIKTGIEVQLPSGSEAKGVADLPAPSSEPAKVISSEAVVTLKAG